MAGCRTGQVRLLYIAPERLMLDNFLDHGALEPGAAGGG